MAEGDVFHFFCRNSDPDKRSTSSILRTMISQVLSSTAMTDTADNLEEVLEKIWGICETYPDVKLTSVDTLWKMLEIVLGQFSQTTLLIDALDECDAHGQDRAFLIRKLVQLSSSCSNIRVLVTSRDL